MKRLLPAIILLYTSLVMAQPTSVGIFQQHADIGNPAIKGGVLWNSKTQTYSAQRSRL